MQVNLEGNKSSQCLPIHGMKEANCLLRPVNSRSNLIMQMQDRPFHFIKMLKAFFRVRGFLE